VTRGRLLAAASAVVLVAGLLIGSPASAAVAEPATAESGNPVRPIVVIGTGGLAWSDVSALTTPALWSALRGGATAALTVRSVHANTCPVDGWLTLSAGEQAADAPGGSDAGARPPCRALPARLTAGRVPHWSEYRAAAAATRFDASPGLLADQVAGHGQCVQAVGPGAALGAARASGVVERYQDYRRSTLPSALTRCAVTLVDVGTVRDPADVSPQDEIRPTTSRAQQVAAIDDRVSAVVKAAPAGTDVILASLADAGVTERLRLAAAIGPHFQPGRLESGSTRQPGLVQLTDLTPTVLEHLGIPRPPSLGGAPLQVDPSGSRSDDQSARDRLRALLDYDQASHEVHALVEPFFYGWALLQLALYLGAAIAWKRRWSTQTQRRRLLGATRRVAIVAASVPASTFLANLLPWWRFSTPLLSVVASVALFTTVISLLALLGPWRRRLTGPPAVVCAATMAVLALDVMTGSRLQLSSLMGLQPVIGGRFYGMGNTTFALFATATLLLCTAIGNHLVRSRSPLFAAATVAAVGLSAVIIDASPSWGSDLGGPTALLPAVVLLVLSILQTRLSGRLLLAVGAGIGGFIVLLGMVDYLRPPESRSHLGRFVQTAIDGGAWDVIVRKLGQNVALLFGYPLSFLVPVVLVLFAYLLARPTSRLTAPLRPAFESIQLLRPGLVAVLAMWTIGFVLNDSGTAIPANGITLAVPLVLAIALSVLEDEMVSGPPGFEGSGTSPALRQHQ
jgi:hypothetical protein